MRALLFVFKFLLGHHSNDFYEYYPVSLTWSEAVDFCNDKGAALATFYDAVAFNKVRQVYLICFCITKISLRPAILVAAGLGRLISLKKTTGFLNVPKVMVKMLI